MNPYYSDDSCTIYHGDCREILPSIEADAVVTDPPYGVGSWSATGGNSLTPAEADEINRWDVVPAAETLSLALGRRVAVVWGGNYLCGLLGPFRTPLLWDKGIRGMHFADGELAWTNFDFGSLRILSYPLAASEVKGNRFHPTQKPVAVMAWSIEQTRSVGTILDPFMGSGTTLRAAKDLGRKAIGIEIEERYCEIAAQRLGQEVLDLGGAA